VTYATYHCSSTVDCVSGYKGSSLNGSFSDTHRDGSYCRNHPAGGGESRCLVPRSSNDWDQLYPIALQ
jgi:hypothetical protein